MLTSIDKTVSRQKPVFNRNSELNFSKHRKRGIQKNNINENHFDLNNLPIENKVVQTKLKVNKPNDKYEQEADRIADQVLRMPAGNSSTHSGIGVNSIQRKCSQCEEEEQLQMKAIENINEKQIQRQEEEEEEELQMKEKPGASHRLEISSSMLSGTNGSSMSEGVRNFFEPRFGVDFSRVKIHSDKQSEELSNTIGARAFTYGSDIYFNRNEYNPDSTEGKRLLSHELTHVLQQNESKPEIQRSCNDGNCNECAGGTKSLWVTAFFRRRATRQTMQALRQKINTAKQVLQNCCVNLKFDFNWDLLSGPDDFDPGIARTGADATAHGAWDYADDSETLGEGTTFSGARGIPMLVVDNVPRTGGGVTVAGDFDREYTGGDYFAIPIDHGKQRAIAHELGHVAGILSHTAGPNIMDGGTSTTVYPAYCTAMRNLADTT